MHHGRVGGPFGELVRRLLSVLRLLQDRQWLSCIWIAMWMLLVPVKYETNKQWSDSGQICVIALNSAIPFTHYNLDSQLQTFIVLRKKYFRKKKRETAILKLM